MLDGGVELLVDESVGLSGFDLLEVLRKEVHESKTQAVQLRFLLKGHHPYSVGVMSIEESNEGQGDGYQATKRYNSRLVDFIRFVSQ